MRQFKKVLLFVGLLIFALNVDAQDKNSPWVIGLGINAIDVTPFGIGDSGHQIKDYFGASDWNSAPVLSRISVARYLDNGFSLDFSSSLNSISLVENNQNEETDKLFMSLGLGVRYDLNELIGDTSQWFDPYLKVSLGSAWTDGNSLGFIAAPAYGFNTWFSDSLGLNFESSYNAPNITGNVTQTIPSGYYFQHSLSLVIRLGVKDSDKDGILDSEDLCPELAGNADLFGCPDSDGDGIADKDDVCPELAGTEATQGCPDTDGDGVANAEDLCPELAGLATDNGCPDTDKDGLLDNKDTCPSEAGPEENGGCPWPDTDKDGVTDNLDNCINERGPVSNNGCPVKLTVEAKKKLGKYAKTIEFNSRKAVFKPGVTETLDIIVGVMKEFDGVRFDVEGHSDSAGNDAKNLKLSQERAQAVVDYLTSHGIDDWRLHAVGYGETKPIASNKTRAGRALNRRVVLSAMESK